MHVCRACTVIISPNAQLQPETVGLDAASRTALWAVASHPPLELPQLPAILSGFHCQTVRPHSCTDKPASLLPRRKVVNEVRS